MNRDEIIQLAENVSSGRANDDELALYNNIYNEFLKGKSNWDEALMGNQEQIRVAIKQGISKRILRKPLIHMHWKRWIAAASVIAAIGIGAYFIFSNKPSKPTEIVKGPETYDIKAPVTNKAMITLSDGRIVSLDSLKSGMLATQGDVKVEKTADGKIVYNGSSKQIIYNTLTNPRGSRVIDMTLADGSRVWLNAGSSITYPVAFVAIERKVTITGEAYFEVKHNSVMPFVVSKGNMKVEVLGTHFNVNAYDDEDNIKVTLLEGSVKVINGGSSGLLKPGEQAQVNGEVNVVHGVDIAAVMAWKNGYFNFNNADIGTVMRQVARWYDVEVIYEGPKPVGHYAGEIPRDASVAEMLKVIKVSGVNFKIEGKKIIVMR